MNWTAEAIGIISGCLIYGAILPKNLVVIKAFLLAGAVGFLTYGFVLDLLAIKIINSAGTVLGVIGLVRAIKGR